jgi:hypothetical protein
MVGAMVTGTAVGIAVFAGVTTGVVSIAVTWGTMRRTRVSGNDILGAIMPAWLMSCVAFAASYWLDGLLAERRTPILLRAGVSGVIFVAVFCATTRLTIRRHLEEALSVMPARVRGPAAKLLRLAVG